jgi:hypothetical protein
MTAAPVRNLLLGAVLLVCAWVPAATLAAPRPAASTPTAEAPAHATVREARQMHRVATAGCPGAVQVQQS